MDQRTFLSPPCLSVCSSNRRVNSASNFCADCIISLSSWKRCAMIICQGRGGRERKRRRTRMGRCRGCECNELFIDSWLPTHHGRLTVLIMPFEYHVNDHKPQRVTEQEWLEQRSLQRQWAHTPRSRDGKCVIVFCLIRLLKSNTSIDPSKKGTHMCMHATKQALSVHRRAGMHACMQPSKSCSQEGAHACMHLQCMRATS
jgi:hypothetical protein